MKSDTRVILESVEKKLNCFLSHSIVSLFLLGFIALVVRLYYFPFEIPITLDGLLYFWYANDTIILGHFPTSYAVENNGWPAFLSFFFYIFHSNNFMDYMQLQRFVTISISTLTIVPVYLLCNRFFDKSYSLVGAAIFAFEPRIIQNSLLGISEPLYIILGASSLFLFLSSNKKLMYASFGIAALTAIVRAEGIFLFFVISILFFLRYRKERREIAKYAIAIGIFILVLLPMAVTRLAIEKQDSITSRLPRAGNEILVSSGHHGGLLLFLLAGFINFVKFLGWAMIPYFLFFTPFGFLLLLKKRSYESLVVILSTIILLLPALFAYLNNSDSRYLFFLYPLFCVLSLYTVKFFGDKVRNRNIFLVLLVGGILLSSSLFLNIKKPFDIEHEKEALKLASYVANNTSVVNKYLPESSYITIAEMTDLKKFPILRDNFKESTQTVYLKADSLSEFMKLAKENGLTHLIIDDNKNRPTFINDVLNHEQKYPYLIKIFDSWDYGYKYHLKIFKINYNKYNVMMNE